MPGGTDRGRGLAMQGHGLVDGQWAVLIERWPSTEDQHEPGPLGLQAQQAESKGESGRN